MLVLWLVGAHLCANQPPYSNIFIKCADEHHEQHGDELLGEVEQNLMQLKTGSQTTPVPKQLHVQLITEVCNPIFLFLPDFHSNQF